MRTEVATLAGGCFWCLEAVFDQLAGVEDVVSGYAGGHVPNPTYKHVCTGETGHADWRRNRRLSRTASIPSAIPENPIDAPNRPAISTLFG